MSLEELADREAIRDALYRYCRGVDRGNEAALRSAYWPDATDDHGAFSGAAAEFVSFALRTVRATGPGIHQLHNILIEFQDGFADVESYFSAWQQLPGPNGFVRSHQKGRYVDRFTERDDEWRIEARVVIFDWTESLPEPEISVETRAARLRNVGRLYPDDLVYTVSSPSIDETSLM